MDKFKKLSVLFQQLKATEESLLKIKQEINEMLTGGEQAAPVVEKKARAKRKKLSYYSRQKLSASIKKYWATAPVEKRNAHVANIKARWYKEKNG